VTILPQKLAKIEGFVEPEGPGAWVNLRAMWNLRVRNFCALLPLLFESKLESNERNCCSCMSSHPWNATWDVIGTFMTLALSFCQ